MLERIDGFITYTEETRENVEKARGLIREGYVPVLYANHQSHADKLILSGITQSLVKHGVDDRVSDFLVPVAATIESGAQGVYIQKLLSLFDPLYSDRGYGADVVFITDNDRRLRGVSGSNSESVRQLMGAPRDGHGLVMFPEATLMGGRLGEDGTVNGMREVLPSTGGGLIGYPKFWLNRGLGEAVFIPIGISGSYRLYPPDEGRNEISPEVIAGILGDGRIEAVVTISVGSPYTYSDLRGEAEGELDHKQRKHLDLMMGKVAELLPTTERGYYGTDRASSPPSAPPVTPATG
jgi:1-acyl-sn-glycerol-3-phosphate acyltransferase